MSSISSKLIQFNPPAWFDEFVSAQLYSDHIVLCGNINDLYPNAVETNPTFHKLDETLAFLLQASGAQGLLAHNQQNGLHLVGPADSKLVDDLVKSGVPMGRIASSPGDLVDLFCQVAGNKNCNVALFIDYLDQIHGLPENEINSFFANIGQLDRNFDNQVSRQKHHILKIWSTPKSTYLPNWFTTNNDFLRIIDVELPNLEDRFAYARDLTNSFDSSGTDLCPSSEKLLQQFAIECDGETLIAMTAIAKVAKSESIPLSRISEAIRIYRTGARRNPWISSVLRDRIRNARFFLETRIKGQAYALEKTLDILARSIMGLSGSQSGPRHLRPRGVLFLAGPTGVGKTELAKAITELLFGDQTSCQRFDMSEFMEERSITRLIGAPPGHPGHERGGELVNAAHKRPFSVFLFDEVEKAHPRIFDVFLQVLDEGRLTDARGHTAHFSEALIIFTSNIGVVTESRVSNQGLNVLPSDTHSELESKIGRSVKEHFHNELRRPELLNRIGQNVVVFDFLSPESSKEVFAAILDRVIEAVRIEHNIQIEVSSGAFEKLLQLCTADRFDGGRGISNRIETHFINPLSRTLFDKELNQDLQVSNVFEKHGRTNLSLKAIGGREP